MMSQNSGFYPASQDRTTVLTDLGDGYKGQCRLHKCSTLSCLGGRVVRADLSPKTRKY